MKQLGKPRGGQAVERRQPSAHLSVSVMPIAADEFVARAAGVVGADLEAGREDEAVELVFDAVGHHALLGDLLDALAIGIDQRHILPVEGRQVVVVEAGPFAELAVPGLECFGGRRRRRRSRRPAHGSAPSSEVGQLDLSWPSSSGDRSGSASLLAAIQQIAG